MALPTLSSRWGPMSIEKRWQNMHEHHHRHNQRWNDVVRYHSENALRSSWSARQQKLRNGRPEGDLHSSGFVNNNAKSKQISSIHSRRQKLAKMLQKENEELEKQLSSIRVYQSSSSLDLMKDRTEELRSARQEKNRRIAEEKLYEHWKINNHELRTLDSELHLEHVRDAWGLQTQHKQAFEEEEKENERQFANEYEEARVRSLKNLRKIEEDRLRAEKERAKVLKLQMEELEERAKESERLQSEEAKILQEQLKLEKIEEMRQFMQKQAKQKELGVFLHRQYKAQMRNRAREIQNELEMDRQILGRILEEQKKEEALQSARQEKARKDIAWMKEVMEEQLKLEKEREAELDLMYREEARQVWDKREEVWKKERQAREQLVRDVLDERSSQLAEKLEKNKKKQQELLKERNDLISAMESAKVSSEQDKHAQERLKIQQRDDLEQQLTSRREKTARQMDEAFEEREAEKEAERGYRAFLQAETSRRRNVGYQPQKYGRRRVAWD